MADDIMLQDWLGGAEWLSIVLAAAASFFIGFLWYTPLFGRVWAREMNVDFDHKPEAKTMVRGMILSLLGQLLTAFVLWHSIFVFIPSLWAQTLGSTAQNSSPALYAANGGFFLWLGYFLPQQLTRVAWEGASWKLLGINAAHDLVRLMAMAFILAYMGPI